MTISFDGVVLGVYDNVSGEYGIWADMGMYQSRIFWTEPRPHLTHFSDPKTRDAFAHETVRRWNEHDDLVKAVEELLPVARWAGDGGMVEPEWGEICDKAQALLDKIKEARNV